MRIATSLTSCQNAFHGDMETEQHRPGLPRQQRGRGGPRQAITRRSPVSSAEAVHAARWQTQRDDQGGWKDKDDQGLRSGCRRFHWPASITSARGLPLRWQPFQQCGQQSSLGYAKCKPSRQAAARHNARGRKPSHGQVDRRGYYRDQTSLCCWRATAAYCGPVQNQPIGGFKNRQRCQVAVS